jgi:hypothetical protein
LSDELLDLLRRENVRLQQEVQRLRAMESSRWWRLNPRRLLRRHDAEPGSGRDPASAAQADEPPESDTDGRHARFREDVTSRGTFTADWLLGHTPRWETIMRELEGRGARLLEIGSYEGLSACYLLWRLEDATITCVDTFEGSLEHEGDHVQSGMLETIFDANVALVDATRVNKRVGDSRRVLLELLAGEERFDFVYVDGSHLALDVLIDAAFTWRLLNVGGFLLFDDYRWSNLGDDPLLRPGPAIDVFLALVDGRYELVFRGWQLALRKTST